MDTVIKLSDYSLKAVKTFVGRDGYGLNANLYKGKKKVATILDTGDGGEMDINWVDFKEDEVEITETGFSGEKNTYPGTPEQKILIDLISKEPPQKYGEEYSKVLGEEYYLTIDTFINEMVEEQQRVKKIKSLCKKNVCFKLKSNKPNHCSSFKGEFTPQIKKHIEDKFGDDLMEIYNETICGC